MFNTPHCAMMPTTIDRKISREGESQNVITTDIGIALLEIQLVEKISNAAVLAPTTIVTALYLHLITHVNRKSKQFFLT